MCSGAGQAFSNLFSKNMSAALRSEPGSTRLSSTKAFALGRGQRPGSHSIRSFFCLAGNSGIGCEGFRYIQLQCVAALVGSVSSSVAVGSKEKFQGQGFAWT